MRAAKNWQQLMGMPSRVAILIPNLARDNDHEVLATVRATGAALRVEKMDWFDLAQACAAPAPSSATAPRHGSTLSHKHLACFGDMARACRDLDRGRLSPREREFIATMVARGFRFQALATAGRMDGRDPRPLTGEGLGVNPPLAFTTPVQAVLAIIGAQAVFTVQPHADQLGMNFTYKMEDSDDLDPARQIVAAVESRPPFFFAACKANAQHAVRQTLRGAA